MPNREGTAPKSRTLNVTKASARPFTAASSTISSPGSRSCGRHKKCVSTASAIAIIPFTKISTSCADKPEANRCSACPQVASYSKARATVSNSVGLPRRAARRIAADAPLGLRIAATITSVSSITLTPHTISYRIQYLSSNELIRCLFARSRSGLGGRSISTQAHERSRLPVSLAISTASASRASSELPPSPYFERRARR